MKIFKRTQDFLEFINTFEGEICVKGNEAYFNDKLVAKYKKQLNNK